MSYPDMLGVEPAADQGAFLFLEPVACRDICMVPDTTAVFAQGLEVERLACFAGPRIHVHMEGSFSAASVIAGLGRGAAYVGKGATVNIGALCGHVLGVAREQAQNIERVSKSELLPWRAEDSQRRLYEEVAERLRHGESSR